MRFSLSFAAFLLVVTVASQPAPAASLAHVDEIAPGVYVAGFAHRHKSANCGWVAISDRAVLIDLPPAELLTQLLSKVADTTGKPPRTLVLTRFDKADAPVVESLVRQSITTVVTSPHIRNRLLAATENVPPAAVEAVSTPVSIGDAAGEIVFMPLEGIVGTGGAAVHLPQHEVLFAGSFVLNGPRAPLSGTDTGRWVATLRRLEKLAAKRVVPGFGTWGTDHVLTRQRRCLEELRRQVGYLIAQGRPKSALLDNVLIGGELLVWMPGDRPTNEDIEHVYREMTVPAAPYNGRPPEKSDPRLHAARGLSGATRRKRRVPVSPSGARSPHGPQRRCPQSVGDDGQAGAGLERGLEPMTRRLTAACSTS